MILKLVSKENEGAALQGAGVQVAAPPTKPVAHLTGFDLNLLIRSEASNSLFHSGLARDRWGILRPLDIGPRLRPFTIARNPSLYGVEITRAHRAGDCRGVPLGTDDKLTRPPIKLIPAPAMARISHFNFLNGLIVSG
jgi:hypothetical protein